MNQSELVNGLLNAGWMKFQPDNADGWKFFFRRNRELDHAYFGPGHDYLTLFPNCRTVEGIIETGYQRWKRQKQEILFRDFRDYPNWR